MQRAVIVGVGDAEELVETVSGWAGIPGDDRDATCRRWPSRSPGSCTVRSAAFSRGLMPTLLVWLSAPVRLTRLGVTAGQERRPRRRCRPAARRRSRESQTVASQPVDVRRLNVGRPVAAEVAVALVIGKDEDDVRRRARPQKRTTEPLRSPEQE